MNQIQNPAGLRVLESLIQLVRNSDEIEKVLTEIHRARDEANKQIAVVGSIEDAKRFRAEADAALQQAETVLTDAKRDGEVLLHEAADKSRAVRQAQQRADAARAAFEEKLADLESRESRITAREQELQSDMDSARKIKENFADLFN